MSEILSYVGPNIPKLGLTRYQTYIGGIPKFPDTLKEEQAAKLRRLFVPVSKLSEVMATVEKKGTAYNKFYLDGLDVRKEYSK